MTLFEPYLPNPITVIPDISAFFRPILSTMDKLIAVDITFIRPNPTEARVELNSEQNPTALKTSAA